MTGQLLSAGNETTTSLIGNMTYLLLSDPEQWHAVLLISRCDPRQLKRRFAEWPQSKACSAPRRAMQLSVACG